MRPRLFGNDTGYRTEIIELMTRTPHSNPSLSNSDTRRWVWNPNEPITTRDNLVFRGQSLQGDRPGATTHRTKVAPPYSRLLSELIRIDPLRR